MPKSDKQLLQKGLPGSPETEKILLGSIVRDGSKYANVVGAIKPEMFVMDKHKRIWERMADLAERGEVIDRVTVANELDRKGQLALVDGLSYIVSLDDGMPEIASLDAYVRIVIEKYRLRQAIYAAEKIKNQALSGEFSADEVSLGGQAMLADETGGYGQSQIESVREYIESYPGGVNVLLDPSKQDAGIPTGFRDFDEITGGFHATEIFLVGARPSHGKTAFSCNVAKTVARSGKTVAFFSCELSKQMLFHRIVCEEAYVSYFRFRKGDLNDEDRRRVRLATTEIMDLPLYLDDTSGLRIADIRVKLNRIIRNRPVDLLVIDYAQLIRAPKGARYNNDNDKFTLIGEEIKSLTKDTRIPLLLLSQLNRDSEKAKGEDKPKLSQCRGSGVWEEISFVGACLYREWLRRREREELRDQAELMIEKNRSGPAQTVKLSFTQWLMRFSNYEG